MIFVDSSAWIALLNARDQHHDEAKTIFDSLPQRRMRIITTDYVIDETITRLRYDSSHSEAVKFLNFIDSIEQQGLLTIVSIDSSLFQEARRLFVQLDSASLSFTDCASFAVCQKHEIVESFAFDSHFEMMGIPMLG